MKRSVHRHKAKRRLRALRTHTQLWAIIRSMERALSRRGMTMEDLAVRLSQ